ncbi:MAG TPA: hypothetical protein VJN71_01495 [Nitrososphaerales archaeon]|nr:hypothetical protein [Nitrososphaerales archaeon]
MSEFKRQILVGGAVAFVLAVLAVAGSLYIPSQIAGSSTTTVTVSQQTTTSQAMSQSTFSSSSSSTKHFVPSPQTIDTTNSTLGLDLSLSLSSTIIPSGSSIEISTSIFNTLSTQNNLSESNYWAVPYLSSGSCDTLGNSSLTPEGIDVFSGNYAINNISIANSVLFWAQISCISPGVLVGNNYDFLINIASYSFLPRNDSGYYAAFYELPTGMVVKGIFPTVVNTGNITIWANVKPGIDYNTLWPSQPGTYTVAAGDEWGQLVLLHFQVVASSNTPSVGDFLSSYGACDKNGNAVPCTTEELTGAFIFNCASEAATSAGCAAQVASALAGSDLPSSYTITVWYPYSNQPAQPAGANCKYSVMGDTAPPYGYCYSVNSTAFVLSFL